VAHRHGRGTDRGRGRPASSDADHRRCDKPFSFEGAKRRQQAEEGVRDLQGRRHLIVIPNDRLLQICDEKVSMQDAFRIADDVLRQASRA